MKYSIALLVALSVLGAQTAQAGGVEDVARANCTKAIASSAAQVSRGDIKKFQFTSNGSGFLMSGYDENHHPVSCEAAADGHVVWIHGG